MAQPCAPRSRAVILSPVCALGDSSTAPFARLRRAVPTGGRRSRAWPPSHLLGVRAETKSRERRVARCPDGATLRTAKPRGDPEPGLRPGRQQHCTFRPPPAGGADRRSAFPCLAAVSSVGGTCGDKSHPDDWGLRRRGPAGRCADRRSAFQAVPANLLAQRNAAAPKERKARRPEGRRALKLL